MRRASPAWTRAAWAALLCAAIFVPLYFLGVELRANEVCAEEFVISDFVNARQNALWTWAASLVCVGVAALVVLKLAPPALGAMPVWVAFAVWKAMALGLAFLTVPSCFEDYGGTVREVGMMEYLFLFGTMFTWAIFVLMTLLALVWGPPRDTG